MDQENTTTKAPAVPPKESAKPAPKKRATRGPSIGDVAKAAGVSAQTVSRVSNGLTNVEETTKNRVLDAMKQLGYRPNRAARALKSGQFKSIGVIMFTLSSFGNMRTLDAIATAASRAGYSVTLIPVQDPTTGTVSGAYERLREQQVDGVVVIFEAHLLDDADITLPEDLPAVVIDSNAGFGYPMVDTDQAQGARFATQHLLDLGHRQVWHIGGPTSSFSATHREESWKRTLEEAGIDPPPSSTATGPPSPATKSAWNSHATRMSRPSLPPMTKWPWGQCVLCTNKDGAFRTMSALWDSTTWTSPHPSGRH